MTTLREADPRFRHLGLKVGAFLAVMAGLLVVMLAILLWRLDVMHPRAALSTRPERAQAITRGMDVTLHGIRVGRVVSVELGQDGQPLVRFEIRKSALRWLREGAFVRLSGLEPFAIPYLELAPGEPDAPPLAPQATLPFARDPSLGDMMNAIEKQLGAVMEQAAKLAADLNRPDGDVRQSLAHLRETAAAASSQLPQALEDARASARLTREFLDEFLGEDGEAARLRQSLATVGTSMEKSVPGILREIEESLASLQRTARQIEKTSKSASPEAEELVKAWRDAGATTEKLIADIRRIWFIKMLLPRQPPQEARQPSMPNSSGGKRPGAEGP